MHASFRMDNLLKLNVKNVLSVYLAAVTVKRMRRRFTGAWRARRQGKEEGLLALSPGWNRNRIKRVEQGGECERKLTSIDCF